MTIIIQSPKLTCINNTSQSSEAEGFDSIMRFSLLIIDPQVDFHSGGSLSVDGADEDAQRTSAFIRSHVADIDSIFITLDSHRYGHIANQSFWQDCNGKEPDVFSVITHGDITSGKWRPKDLSQLEYCLSYASRLEHKGRFQLTIWPVHCVEGTPGHEVVPNLAEAVAYWESKAGKCRTVVKKGQSCLTEMYSALQAEVPIDTDSSTCFNEDLLSMLRSQRKVVIVGQALSHCVNFSTRDIVDKWAPLPTSNLVVITDGSSPVSGYQYQADQFISDMRDRGLSIHTFETFCESLRDDAQ